MDSSIPPTKSGKESGALFEGMRKEEIREIIESQQAHPETSANSHTVEKEKPISVSPKSLSDGSKSNLDAAMRNQISSSRAVTVEIDTLRDIMPKLRKEIHTYTINESMLVKELEKKLPACKEHKDVRLNMVLEEIERVRLNRRKTLSKLKESIVKVVELQSRMEVNSYEAGEIFWNGRISKLSGESYSNLDIFAHSEIEDEIEDNFGSAPTSNLTDGTSLSISVKRPSTIAQTRMSKSSEQGYFEAEANAISTTPMSASNMFMDQSVVQKSNQREYAMPQMSQQSREKDMPIGSELISIKSSETSIPATTTQANPSVFGQAPPDATPNSVQKIGEVDGGKSKSDNAEASAFDIEKVVSEAQKQAKRTRIMTRRGIILAMIPPAAVAGIILVDWLTGFISKAIGHPFG